MQYISYRRWNPEDLEDETLIRSGIMFGDLIWRGALKGFKQNTKKRPRHYPGEEHTWSRTEGLLNKLVEYYQTNVFDVDYQPEQIIKA
jgi:hypothetical protein